MFYDSIATVCPVCGSMLGWRKKDTFAELPCKECDTIFYWRPKAKLPTNNRMYHHQKQYCTREGCICHS